MQPYFFATDNPQNTLAYGENVFKGFRGEYSTHAEEQALRNLPYAPRKKRPTAVDLLIIRTTRTGTTGNSKPCTHCLCVLSCYLPIKGYSLRNIYYTDTTGGITQANLRKLIHENTPHVSRFYKERGFELKSCKSKSASVHPVNVQ